MNGTDGQSDDLAAGGQARPGGVAPVVIALTAAVAFGAVDQYLPVAMSMSSRPGAYLFVVEISKMSAPWLLVPFLAGAWQGGTGWLIFPWPLQGSGVAAEFAELAVGLLLTGAVIRVIARGRTSARA